jgi:hypothetical protein
VFNHADAKPDNVVGPAPNVVEGTVKTIDGRPVPGAVIRVSGATGAARGTTLKAVTDSRGNYRITVPLGHYNVDGFVDVTYDGQTYKEIWLDRGDAPCDRVMSDKGIVRHFILRLSGRKRCFNLPDANNPNAYNGAYITAMTSEFPDDAVITFTLVPVGNLADGRPGSTIAFRRTGAALKRGGGPIDETSYLYNIPLGRYRMKADVRYANGQAAQTTLELRDGGNTSGRELEIAFAAAAFGGGIRPVGIGLTPGKATAPERDGTPTPEAGKPTPAPVPPAELEQKATPAPPAPAAGIDLPIGRYSCTYRSQYAGDIPTDKSITIMAGGRYRAYGKDGTYAVDAAAMTVKWIGPLGEGDVRATFGKRNGLPMITVIGGGASEDPDKTNYCTLIR